MAANTSLLVLGGCPRSGTTALARLLNGHARVLLGNERYYRLFEHGTITPAQFERERFLTIEEGDTHDEPPGLAAGPRPHWLGVDPAARWGGARLVGDKFPPLFRAYDLIAKRLPEARLVYVLREPLSVAESYQARADDPGDAWPFDAARAVSDWNESVRRTAAETRLDLVVVTYETILRDEAAVETLLRRLGLDPEEWETQPAGVLSKAAAMGAERVPRRTDVRRLVAEQADFDAYRALLKRALC